MSAQTRSKYIFEEAPIPNAVMTLAVPTIITQLINIIYNYADTWYVGRTGNAAMVAALSVCFPIFVILAAIATFLSNCASLFYFIIFLIRHRDHPVFTADPRDISFEDHIPQDVLAIGLPAALQTTLAMVSNIFANVLVRSYGSGAVAGMGVAKKINMIAFNTCMGLTQGVLPLLGYNYGSGNCTRLKKTIAFSGSIVFAFGCICTLVFRTFAAPLVRFFIDEPESVRYGTMFLGIIAFAAPLAALSYMTNTVFQASGHKVQSFLLSTLRKGFADIPAMFVFRYLIGIEGVVLATPFAEIVSAVLAIILFTGFIRKLDHA